MTLLVAAVIVHDETINRVVLLQRSQNAKFAQGMWDLPVGKSEPGEPITETAVRELYEETGLTVMPESLKVAHISNGAWAGKPPTASSPSSSPPTNGPANPRTGNLESTPRSAGSAPTPSPRSSWIPPPAPSIATSATGPRSRSTVGKRGHPTQRCTVLRRQQPDPRVASSAAMYHSAEAIRGRGGGAGTLSEPSGPRWFSTASIGDPTTLATKPSICAA